MIVQPYTFLSGLPALLGLAGFVLYQVLWANKAGDEVSRRIIDKIRIGATGDRLDQRLTPRQVARLVEQQQKLRHSVGEHDFHLLKQALTQQFVLTVITYVLTLGFCGWSVYLFVQQRSATSAARSDSASQVSGGTVNQSSSGNNSPNTVSQGSGPTTVTTQEQTPSQASPKGKTK
jgi:hypothetical protein